MPNTTKSKHRESWKRCLEQLKAELGPQQFNMWVMPLQLTTPRDSEILILVPNSYVLDHVRKNCLTRIREIMAESCAINKSDIKLAVGSSPSITATKTADKTTTKSTATTDKIASAKSEEQPYKHTYKSYLNPAFTFANFVEGNSNQLARAASLQVAENIGKAYNPLFIYGGVGLGKTHLMHAIGNSILQNNPQAEILYLHSERFVADMVKALQHNTINEFKKFYRSLDALLLDDIQFLAGKERSQEEFFHTFNALFEGQQQIILTCDRYPKEINGLEERLKSRFGWGLTVAIEPPELETRVAILLNKAHQSHIELPSDVAFFVAKNIQSNVRELEGALKRVIASAHFTNQPITLEFAKTALKDLLAMRARLVTIENIQKIVAEYFKIKLAEITSKKRTRSIARPRQIAMALAKELTNHSLPEIATAFGGRDHTTVIHACRKVKELIASNTDVAEDYRNLLRILLA